jgi:hypothetical protein
LTIVHLLELSQRALADVLITVTTLCFKPEMVRRSMAAGHAYTPELAKVHDVTFVDLPTGVTAGVKLTH